MLFVSGPPRISPKLALRQKERSSFIRLGVTLTMTCPVEADPPAITTWFKDGEDIHQGWERFLVKSHHGILRVLDVEREDAGVYQCRATNGFGTVEYQLILHVLCE